MSAPGDPPLSPLIPEELSLGAALGTPPEKASMLAFDVASWRSLSTLPKDVARAIAADADCYDAGVEAAMGDGDPDRTPLTAAAAWNHGLPQGRRTQRGHCHVNLAWSA
jgi:hypothetical protein